ncbi:PEP-CTERM sorting domain-containing protein [bacterium]|nr:PEP-CTERM sorting domain-containing protein [bacterium]
MSRLITFAALAALVFSATSAEAGWTYGFAGVTNNSPVNTAIGENQLAVEVVRLRRSSQVQLLFTNSGPDASSITDVYLDDESSLFSSIRSIQNYSGVSFSQGATPGNLPGGNNLEDPFVTTLGLNADSDPPVEKNGVNPGEKLGITLNLASGVSFSDVIAAINSAALRVGIHVQGFANGGSESFVNVNPTNPDGPPIVPEPTGLALAGIALGGLLVKRRRRSHSDGTIDG